MMLMLIKYQFKKSHTVQRAHFNFIGYNDNDVIRPLCVRLPQMMGYAKKFNENATMSFRANNFKSSF